MTIFLPTRALVSVDLPALGRPTKQAKPERKRVASAAAVTVAPRGRFDGCDGKRTPETPPSVRLNRCDGKRTPQRLSQLAHIEDLALDIHRPDR